MAYSLIATARNEGPFILEWVAHHLSLGFDKIFVATNDCDDQTNLILDLIGQKWPIYRIENSSPTPGNTFQRSAVLKCLAHPEMGEKDWVLHIDIDEFLNIDAAEPDVATFIAPFKDADAVMILWKTFGDNNRSFWDGGSILDGFHRCQGDFRDTAAKSFFRRDSFDDCTPHSPQTPRKPVAGLRIVTTGNLPVDALPIANKRGGVLIPEDFRTYQGACLNHYMHKSRDLVRFGRELRGDANGRRAAWRRRTVGMPEYEMFNRNETADFSIQANRDARIEALNGLIEIPGVLAAHYASQTWFFEQLQQLTKD